MRSPTLTYWISIAMPVTHWLTMTPQQKRSSLSVTVRFTLFSFNPFHPLLTGKVDMVVLGAGTGGTVTGVGRKMKEKLPDVKVK